MFTASCVSCSQRLPFYVRDEWDSALHAACPTCHLRFWRLEPVSAGAGHSKSGASQPSRAPQDVRTAYQAAAVSASACAVSREKLRDLSEQVKTARKIMEAAQERHQRAQAMLPYLSGSEAVKEALAAAQAATEAMRQYEALQTAFIETRNDATRYALEARL